jgi:hypothetical protein
MSLHPQLLGRTAFLWEELLTPLLPFPGRSFSLPKLRQGLLLGALRSLSQPCPGGTSHSITSCFLEVKQHLVLSALRSSSPVSLHPQLLSRKASSGRNSSLPVFFFWGGTPHSPNSGRTCPGRTPPPRLLVPRVPGALGNARARHPSATRDPTNSWPGPFRSCRASISPM